MGEEKEPLEIESEKLEKKPAELAADFLDELAEQRATGEGMPEFNPEEVKSPPKETESRPTG